MDYIKVKVLSKSYSDIKALKNLAIEIEAGTLFGILGPNGACLLYTSPSPRDCLLSRMPSSA